MTWEYTREEKERRFLEAVAEVCRQHGFSISHEDAHGAFVVEPYSDDLVRWLMDALIRH